MGFQPLCRSLTGLLITQTAVGHIDVRFQALLAALEASLKAESIAAADGADGTQHVWYWVSIVDMSDSLTVT